MKSQEVMKEVMAFERITQAELADRVGKGQTAIANSLKRNMRIDIFVETMKAMGYEVVVRKENRELIITE